MIATGGGRRPAAPGAGGAARLLRNCGPL